MKKSLNYKPSYNFKEADRNQEILDDLYNYGKDISTRVFHRMRINTIYGELNRLKETGVLKGANIRALDIGCNCGYLSKLISEFDIPFVLGIDLSKEKIELANLFFGQEGLVFKTEDATNINITEKFNLILCTEVIEHTDKPNKVIKTIYRLLSDDGVALISMPNRLSLNYVIPILGKKLLKKPLSKDFRQHIDYPFCKTIKMFKKEGFKIVKSQGVNFLLLDHLLPFLLRSKLIIRIDAFFTRLFPFKYFSQFFFIILVKNHE